jgi:hypothetical protein
MAPPSSPITASVHLPPLSAAATSAHVFPPLSPHSQLSIAQWCDEGCIATFTADDISVTHDEITVLHATATQTRASGRYPSQSAPLRRLTRNRHSPKQLWRSITIPKLPNWSRGPMRHCSLRLSPRSVPPLLEISSLTFQACPLSHCNSIHRPPWHHQRSS